MWLRHRHELRLTSGTGYKRTSLPLVTMSAFRPKADIAGIVNLSTGQLPTPEEAHRIEADRQAREMERRIVERKLDEAIAHHLAIIEVLSDLEFRDQVSFEGGKRIEYSTAEDYRWLKAGCAFR